MPDGYDADGWMDEVEAMLRAWSRTRAPRRSTSTSSRSASRTTTCAGWARWPREHGLDLRAHVEQFNANRSVPVALEAGARSVDHLACLHPDDIAPLAAAECAAVLLPGAEFMGAEHVPPARELADAGALCVLATDANPGTSPIVSMPLIVGLAVRRYGWSVREALLAATLNAAWVLRLSDVTGSLEVGKRADVAAARRADRARPLPARPQPGGRRVRRRRAGVGAAGRGLAARPVIGSGRSTAGRSAPPGSRGLERLGSAIGETATA